MVWLVLILSSLLEAVWANALGESDGFTKLGPSLLFIVAIIPGMLTLAYVAKRIPMSTAYAVWAGLGAAFTVLWAMLTGTETATLIRILLLLGIVGSVIGLKLLKPPPAKKTVGASGLDESQKEA